jgi:hypothetical protein
MGRSMAMESLHGVLETSTRATILKISVKATEKCIGLMGVITKAVGKKVVNKDRVILH